MLGPLSNTIQGVVSLTWPMIIISIIIIVSFRLAYLFKNKEKLVLYKELLMLSFIIYILCLFQVVTFQDDVSFSTNNFIPLKEIFRYNIGSRLFFKNVLGNMVMFLPFGFFISYYLKSENAKLTLFLTLIASVSIEEVHPARPAYFRRAAGPVGCGIPLPHGSGPFRRRLPERRGRFHGLSFPGRSLL